MGTALAHLLPPSRRGVLCRSSRGWCSGGGRRFRAVQAPAASVLVALLLGFDRGSGRSCLVRGTQDGGVAPQGAGAISSLWRLATPLPFAPDLGSDRAVGAPRAGRRGRSWMQASGRGHHLLQGRGVAPTRVSGCSRTRPRSARRLIDRATELNQIAPRSPKGRGCRPAVGGGISPAQGRKIRTGDELGTTAACRFPSRRTDRAA